MATAATLEEFEKDEKSRLRTIGSGEAVGRDVRFHKLDCPHANQSQKTPVGALKTLRDPTGEVLPRLRKVAVLSVDECDAFVAALV